MKLFIFAKNPIDSEMTGCGVYGSWLALVKCRMDTSHLINPSRLSLMDHLHLTTTTFFFLNPGSDSGSVSCGVVGKIVDIDNAWKRC